jgi:hypothetical protein
VVVLGQVTEKFRDAVKVMAERQHIPVDQFNHKERKDEVANQIRQQRGLVTFMRAVAQTHPVTGHEWAKRQLEKKGIAYQALDNGFLSCAEPNRLQEICDSLGPEQIERLFRKWLKCIPLP